MMASYKTIAKGLSSFEITTVLNTLHNFLFSQFYKADISVPILQTREKLRKNWLKFAWLSGSMCIQTQVKKLRSFIQQPNHLPLINTQQWVQYSGSSIRFSALRCSRDHFYLFYKIMAHWFLILEEKYNFTIVCTASLKFSHWDDRIKIRYN